MANNNNSGGIGFLGLLTIVFITLKLTDTIAWSWVLVLSPVLIPLGFVGLVLLVAVVLAFIKIVKEYK